MIPTLEIVATLCAFCALYADRCKQMQFDVFTCDMNKPKLWPSLQDRHAVILHGICCLKLIMA